MCGKKVLLLVLFSAVYLWIAASEGLLDVSSDDSRGICATIELEEEVNQFHFWEVMLPGFGTPVLKIEPIFIAFSNDLPVASPRTREASPILLRGPPTSQS